MTINRIDAAVLLCYNTVSKAKHKHRRNGPHITMKIRKVIRIAVIILAALVIFDLAAGFFLMRFAIARKTGDEAAIPSYSISEEGQRIVSENRERLFGQAEEWLNASSVSKVSITADDGAVMKGDLVVTDSESHLWALLLHGYSRTRTRVYSLGLFYAQNGYNVVMPDLRGHGESGGDYIGMGWLDRKDVLKWLDLIISRDSAAKIVIQGGSMGAATAMMASGDELPANVKAIVEDCGYTSVRDIFSDVLWDHARLPAFPLVYTAELYAVILAGYSFSEASALEQIKKCAVPVLFIHGDSDNFVHTDMVYKLYDACPTEKELLIMEDAAHGQSLYRDPDRYFDTVFAFLSRYAA